MNKKRAKLTQ